MNNKKPNFTDQELHDLYDLIYITDWELIELNKLEKSWNSIQKKLEDYCIPELKEEKEE